MKRHKSLVPLSQFHRKALFVALMLKRNAPPMEGYPEDPLDKAVYVQDFFFHELKPHFDLEQQALYPSLAGRGQQIEQLVTELLEERTRLNEMVEALSEPCSLEDRLDELGRVLEGHIRKEERQLFEQAQDILDPAEMTAVATELERLQYLQRKA